MAMATEQRKTRGELRAMFWHDFVGSLADNMVEVNWMLVVTLFPVMVGTDDIVAMFGLTDTPDRGVFLHVHLGIDR